MIHSVRKNKSEVQLIIVGKHAELCLKVVLVNFVFNNTVCTHQQMASAQRKHTNS